MTMSRASGRVHEMEHHAADRATTRPVVAGTQGVVSAGHPLVSMAGMRMLLAGGNAFDAAVAAGFAAAVVEPTASYTLCGECVALIHDARRGEIHAVSGQGTAAALATPALFRERGLDRIPTGPGPDAHLSFTVPGAVDAYLTLLETFGTRSLAEALAPAVQYAERGFPMYEYMRRMLAIAESRSQFDLYPPGGTDVFYPGGRVPAVGELLVQPALGAARAARERFYRGDVAAMIGAFSERLGGLLRASDLAGYRARLEPPLRTTFAGREILGQSAWTQGPVLMQALGMLEAFDLRALGHVHELAVDHGILRQRLDEPLRLGGGSGCPLPLYALFLRQTEPRHVVADGFHVGVAVLEGCGLLHVQAAVGDHADDGAVQAIDLGAYFFQVAALVNPFHFLLLVAVVWWWRRPTLWLAAWVAQ